MDRQLLRNVAIIAHVDHGKTTLVDQMLYQSGMFRVKDLDRKAGGQHGLIMDSNDLERERGITIFSKQCALMYEAEDGRTYKINVIDTPGHADFGGEVERVLMMADGVLLLVDAFEGPMPQTRFVMQKALEHRLRPLVIVNKVDRGDARPDAVVDEVFDLLVQLDADDPALDFSVLYASAREGWATADLDQPADNLRAVFESIVQIVPPPRCDPDKPFQMHVTTLEFNDYTGRVAIGRVANGTITEGQSVAVFGRDGRRSDQRALQLCEFEGLGRKRAHRIEAGEICAVVGLDPIDIGDTIACGDQGTAMPRIHIDEPTLHMTFHVNDSPFSGRDGRYLTSRQIGDRLDKEIQSNVALRVNPGDTPEQFRVCGRGLMHLGILLENMRREGFEMAAGKPDVIFKDVDGKTHEPIEHLAIDCPLECQSAVMALVGDRRAEMLKMETKAGAENYVHLEFSIPARGLIGMRSRMLTATQGRAIMHHTLQGYEPLRGHIPQRTAGVIVASKPGTVTTYALDGLYDRGVFFVEPGDPVYEGQIVGEHCRNNDIIANVNRTKKLGAVRTAGKDDNAQVRPVREMSLEASLEFVQEDELVEITPKAIRMRKRLLKESDRRREMRRTRSSAG